jgi:hypothetical protein
MEASQQRVFYYHADAAPFGGHFTHPIEQIVPSHGSSSLAQAGGHASSRAKSVRLDGLVSCEEAYSEIYGTVNQKTGSWTTLVTSVFEGLNVVETVTADKVVAILSVEHPLVGYRPKVSLVGSQFENLRIDGVKVNPVLNGGAVTPLPKGDFPAKALVEDGDFVARAVGQSQKLAGVASAPRWLSERFGWIQSEEARRQKGYVLCSLVDEVQGTKPGSSFGHVVQVPGFGNVFLGELLTDQHTFRLTMIRIEMGCPAEGKVSFATANSNGYPMP